MRILLINPNTTKDLTDRLEAAALGVKSPDTELVCVTAPVGVPYISTRSEALIGGTQVLEILAERHGDFDAAIVAAFGDPGLGAARELFDIPVVGLAEAGMLTACMLGGKFSIVTFAEALGPWYRECVAWHRLENRCAGVHMLDGAFSSINGVQDEKEDLLVELAASAVASGDTDGRNAGRPATAQGQRGQLSQARWQSLDRTEPGFGRQDIRHISRQRGNH